MYFLMILLYNIINYIIQYGVNNMKYTYESMVEYLKSNNKKKTTKWFYVISDEAVYDGRLDKLNYIAPRKVTITLIGNNYSWLDEELEYDKEVLQLLEDQHCYEDLVIFDTKKECEEDYNYALYSILEYLNDIAIRAKALALQAENIFIHSDYLTEKLRRS